MEEGIRGEFDNCSFSIEDDDHILPTLLTCCINYKLSPSDLASSWEAYYLSSQLSGSVVKAAHLDGFLLYLQNEAKEKLNKEESDVYSSHNIDTLIGNRAGEPVEAIQSSPTSQNQRPSFHTSTPKTDGRSHSGKNSGALVDRMTPFGQRTTKFTPHFVFNAQNGATELTKQEIDNSDEDEIIRRVQPGQKCSFNVMSAQPQKGCRFMYDRTKDRFNFLENRINKSTDMFTGTGLYGELADATMASEEEIFAVGMIACDAEGHLNDKSVLLQCSAEHSCGQRVRLDLHNLAKFSLFPGQIVGIQGQNPSGHHFVISKVFDSLPIPNESVLHPFIRPSKKQALAIEDTSTIPSPSRVLSVIIASGPFTTSDNLLFEPLQELLAYARRKEPQLLILVGPFVDSEHPSIRKGTVDRSFRDIFFTETISRLQDFTQYMGSSVRIILLPSIRDAHHDAVFPQAAFDLNMLETSTDQITCFANPSLFSANEISFGCCTVDILKQLSGEEISRNPPNEQSDRIGSLATHLLKQQSFYPLYPPALGVPLDFTLAPAALKILSIPDVLLLPSDLAPFTKVLSIGNEGEATMKSLCVNPGRLAKGIGGGTFVELHYNVEIDKTTASIIRI